jgi:hypothetical protein
MRRSRGAQLFVLVLVTGCGARSELLGAFTDDVSIDAGGATDASGVRDAAPPLDAGVIPVDAGFDATLDSGVTLDAATDDAGVDAGFDAASIECTATRPTRIADSAQALDQVAIDSHTVYFHDQNGIHRVAKSGGALTDVTPLKNSNWPDITAFAANDDGVTFWQYVPSTSPTIVVSHIGPNGGAATKLASFAGQYVYGTSHAFGDAFLYYGIPGTTPLDVALTEIAPNGTVTPLSSPGDINFVRNDGVDTYVASNYSIYRVTANDWVQVGIGQELTYIIGLAIDGPTIYFIADDSTEDVMVGAMPKQGGGPTTTLWSSTGVSLGGMDQDDTFLYVVDRFKPAIVRIRKDGTSVDDVVTGVNGESFTDVKVDDKCVYYSYGPSAPGAKPGIFAAPK